jgi:hypothetical protein
MKKFALILAFLSLFFSLSAQEQMSEKDREKKFFEAIDKETERLTTLLDLDDWQIFYVDSILTHDYTALQEEYTVLSKSKVSNSDIYYDTQDKWMEQIYQAYSKVFNEEQWAKYLKSGAARDKKARDKRAAKKKK